MHRERTRLDPLHVCLLCACEYVYLVDALEMTSEGHPALLRCPNCGVHRAGVFGRRVLDALERRRQVGEAELRVQLRRLELTNRIEEIGEFAAALAAGAIVPDDF